MHPRRITVGNHSRCDVHACANDHPHGDGVDLHAVHAHQRRLGQENAVTIWPLGIEYTSGSAVRKLLGVVTEVKFGGVMAMLARADTT